MDNSFQDIILRWARSLDICPVLNLISLTNGKFFYEFLTKYLNVTQETDTTTQTFIKIQQILNQYFPNQHIINIDEAKQGSEEELLKLLTIFLYLGIVEKKNEQLIKSVTEESSFKNEVQLRLKCLLKALSEQHQNLTESLLTQLMMSRVSETTGQLAAPVSRARLVSTEITRAKKTSPGSPVIFAYSPGSSGTPTTTREQQSQDTPVSSQLDKLQQIVEERGTSIRGLKNELESERSEKQYYMSEVEALNKERIKLENEMQVIKQKHRSQMEKEDLNASANADNDLQEKFHRLLAENKSLQEYVDTVQADLNEVTQQKDKLERKVQYLDIDLSKTRTEKNSFELTVTNMSTKLTSAEETNMELKRNIREMEAKVEEMFKEDDTFNLLPGRPSTVSINWMKVDMTNMSLDDSNLASNTLGNDSLVNTMQGLPGSPGGENMGQQIIIPQLEERIESLQAEVNEEKREKEELQQKFANIEQENASLTEQYNTEKQEYEQNIDALKLENTNISQQLENVTADMTNKVTVLEQEKVTLTQELEKNKAELTCINNVVNDLNDRNARLSEELEVGVRVEEQMKQKMVEITQAKEELSHQVEGLESKQAELEVQLSNEQAEKQGLSEQLTEKITMSESLQTQLIQQVDKFDHLEQEVAQTKQDLEITKSQLAETSENLQKENESKEKLIEQYNQEKQETNKLMEDMNAVNVEALANLDSDKAMFENNEAERKVWEEEKARLCSELDTEKAEIQTRLKELARSGEQIGILKADLSEANSQLQTFKEDAEDKTDIIHKLEQDIANLEAKLKELQEDLQVRRQSSEESQLLTEQKLEKKSKELKEKEAELKSVVEKAGLLAESVSRIEAECEAEMTEKTKLNQMIEKQNEDFKKLEVEKNEIGTELQELLAKYTQSQQDKDKLKSDLSNSAEEMTNIKNQLTSLQQEMESITEKSSTSDQVAEDLTTQLAASKEEVAELTAKLLESEQEVSSTLERRSCLQTEVDNLNAELTAYAEQLRNTRENQQKSVQSQELVEEKLVAIENEKEAVEAELAQINISFNQLQNKNLELDSKLKEVEEMVEEREKKKKEKELRILDLENQLANASTDKITTEAKINSLEVQILAEKEQVISLQGQINEEREQVMMENNHMETKLEEFENSRSELIQENVQLKETIAEMSATAQKKDKEMQRLSKQVTNTESTSTEDKHRIDFLEQQLDEAQTERDDLASSVEQATTDKNNLESELKKLEHSNDFLQAELEAKLELLKVNTEKIDGLEKANVEMKESVEKVTESTAENETKLKEEVEKIKLENEMLQERMKQNDSSKQELAKSLSQLVNDINTMKTGFEEEKNKINKKLAEKEKEITALKAANEEAVEKKENEYEEKLKLEAAQIDEIKKALDEKEQEMTEMNEAKAQELADMNEKMAELEKELVQAEIRFTDLQEAAESATSKELTVALDDQKKKYEARLKDIQVSITKDANEKIRAKIVEKTSENNKKIVKMEEEMKRLHEELKLKQNLEDKISELDAENRKEVEVYTRKLQDVEKVNSDLRARYDAAKEMIKKTRSEKNNISHELKEARMSLSHEKVQELQRENSHLIKENNKMTTSLSYADTKIRNLTRESLGGSMSSSRTGSISSRTSSVSSLAGSRPSRPSLSAHPGRATRQQQSAANLTADDSDVFKAPSAAAAHTPGRTRASRTVSDTRVGASRRTRPPHGAGSLFNCDDEMGEVFSSSYLTDLKDGRCDVTDTDESRMSELSRRNTLCLPHLKSTYPIDYQFCTDDDITEDSVRQSKVKPGRATTIMPRVSASPESPVNTRHSLAARRGQSANKPSPVANLSQQTSNLSLNSPWSNTRSRQPVQKPVAFTIDAPATTAPQRRATKQPCKEDHGKTKKECTSSHSSIKQEAIDSTVILSPDYQRQARKRKSDQTRRVDPEILKKPSLDPDVKEEDETDLDLNVSQDTEASYFSRESIRSSKRINKQAGNVSYTKPGPPTPRNKSMNRSRHDNSLTSLESGATIESADVTPSLSRTSSRSTLNMNTPLLEHTNTPRGMTAKLAKKQKQGLTPKIRNVMSSLMKSRKYRLAKKENENMACGPGGRTPTRSTPNSKKVGDLKGAKNTTPLKATDRLRFGARKRIKE